MPDDWLTLADARGEIIAARRGEREEAQAILESDLAEGRRTARGLRVGSGDWLEWGWKTDATGQREWQSWPVKNPIPAEPVPGQNAEEIPRSWWIKAAGATYASDVIVYYDTNKVWSNWKFQYIDVQISPVAPQPKHGDKSRNAKTFIAEHSAELTPLTLNEAARRIAAAVGCGQTTAKNAIRDEKSGGHLSGHK